MNIWENVMSNGMAITTFRIAALLSIKPQIVNPIEIGKRASDTIKPTAMQLFFTMRIGLFERKLSDL